MDKTVDEQLREAIDKLAAMAKLHWESATEHAKKLEQEIHALEEQLERA